MGTPPTGGMTRAERFEDERRRITESVFSKTDPNGALAESYITHIRIQEDSQYPQSPPPPESPPNNKKPRIILVSVKSSGRVRMHKARENPNGSFSIGKTWNMEDLTAVETFANSTPTNEEEAKRKEWAGDIGFIVTVAKPYYWEAGTAKEKEFFIGSLVKIFRKYTQGRVPELIGFTARETEVLLGPSGALSPRPPTGQGRPGPPPPRPGQQRSPNRGYPPGTSPEPPGPPGVGRPPPMPRSRPGTADDDGRRPQPIRDPSLHGPQPNAPYFGARDPSRQPRSQPSMERGMRQPPSREQMRPPPIPPGQRGGGGSTAGSFASSQRLTPQSSRSEVSQNRPATPESGMNALPQSLISGQSPKRRPSPSDDTRSVEEPTFEQPGLGISAPERRRPNGNAPPARREPSPSGLRPGTAQSNGSSIVSRNEELFLEDRARNVPPERRRPPMPSAPASQRSMENESVDDFSAPLQTPLASRPSTRGATDETERMPGAFESPALEPVRTPEPPQPAPDTAVPEIPIRAREPKPATPEPAVPVAESEPAPPVQPLTPRDEEVSRPGLGPMVKKKPPTEVANVLRKAAFAYNAFKPRAGGAGEKLLLKDQQKPLDEADGISGVFKAPRPIPKEEPKAELEEPVEPEKPPLPERGSREVPKIDTGDHVPSVTVSSPTSAGPPKTISEAVVSSKSRSPSPEKAKSANENEVEIRRQKRRSNHDTKYLSKLGIDPSILDGRGLDFEATLVDFGWGSSDLHVKKIEMLETEVRRELGRVEAGSWLGHLEQKDDRVDAVERMLDRAIAECDELEGLLTLYNVELSSLNDDIAFIEAQGQGLQVHTANQKLLQTELNQLVTTISITTDQLEPLRSAPIAKVEGLDAIEASLMLLYKAMITIDPALAQGSRASAAEDPSKFSNTIGFGNSELATMRALQEKRDRYISESTMFMGRLKQFMEVTFGAVLMDTKDAIDRQIKDSSKPPTKLDVGVHDLARNALWKYSPLMLFAKEVDNFAWNELLTIYQSKARPHYLTEMTYNAKAWQKLARKPTGDEQELLFTAQEKEAESLTGAARKLTVKRSQTLARGLRSASGDKEAKSGKAQKGTLHPFEAFASALDEMSPLIFTEQNFITEFFHATTSENIDFPDAVNSAPPEGRHGANLFARKLYEPDRAMAKRVTEVMEDMFSTWHNMMQNLMQWAIEADPLQGVGVLCAIDRKLLELEDTNQDFITRTLQKIQERLTGLFTRFVDEQIRAIEDTKVKIKKRKGVIAFIKTFPHFSIAIENMLPPADDPERLDVRVMVDDAYGKINKAMFESLKVIAKESPAVMATQGQGDPEDKEALNYHILLIENMNHYIEEVDERGDIILGEWRQKAAEEMNEHMTLYVDAVIRRPMGKLLEFLESTESLLSSIPPGTPPTSLAARSSHARPLFKKLVSAHDGKELRRGIEALKKRVDKHYGDADDPGLSRNLVAKVLKECEKMYEDIWNRAVRVNQEVYSSEVEIEWRMEDVAAGFRK
ncbi:uncharacterized protein BDZ99DRAFT_412632 [Mytilinidion resinicola]|uniref:Exocyst complex component Sec3 PIP2-binding N-terminal domain-containing protein n=1 Tax=Mytilinidion resinicola TaxID=574789 RepID=A0A6A6YTL3_9PEZI|nr:uncharacterized protein BDZ99DRAFT_412632 [Mytilinidion resinicola]KAF2812111.1 hypothetical protein BDZ99DRAFT_412632 [Mytilinidion resinicola]